MYLAIEVQPRYSYIIHPAVFILAAGGVQYIYNFISRTTKGEGSKIKKDID